MGAKRSPVSLAVDCLLRPQGSMIDTALATSLSLGLLIRYRDKNWAQELTSRREVHY